MPDPVIVDLAGRGLRYDDLDNLILSVDPQPTHLIMGATMCAAIKAGPRTYTIDFVGHDVRYTGLPVRVLKSMGYPSILLMADQTEVGRIDNCAPEKVIQE